MAVLLRKTPPEAVTGEIPVGPVDSLNVTFTASADFQGSTLKVYLNGQRLTPGAGHDFVHASPTVILNYPPIAGDIILIDYLKAQ
jgi:hypothetical protein